MSMPTLKDRMTFFASWLKSPWRTAAVQPSSQALAQLITSQITGVEAPVIELGAGTGVFTYGLIKRGVPERELVLIEGNPDFAVLLKTRFPRAQVLCMDAADIARIDVMFDGERPGAAISGLPLLTMPRDAVMAIVGGVFALMRDGGALFQFTYMPYCPIPAHVLDHFGLVAHRIGCTRANVPPAAVYRITRHF